MTQELLPLGSILYLEGATSKLMVVGRGPVFESDNEPVYSELDELNYRRVLTIKFKQALKIRINRQR